MCLYCCIGALLLVCCVGSTSVSFLSGLGSGVFAMGCGRDSRCYWALSVVGECEHGEVD